MVNLKCDKVKLEYAKPRNMDINIKREHQMKCLERGFWVCLKEIFEKEAILSESIHVVIPTWTDHIYADMPS